MDFQQKLNVVLGLLLLAQIIIAVPLAVLKKCRGVSSMILRAAFPVVVLLVWLRCLLLTYIAWGFIGIVIGVLLAGVGVIPLSLVALLCKGQWLLFGETLLVVAIAFGLFAFGGWCEGNK